MTDWLLFIVIGATTGSVYGLTAMGLVLTYKTSGIFNFAHGAIAALSVYAYYELHVVRGLPQWVALVGSVVVLPPLIALVMERIARALADATTSAKIVATVGIQLAITSALIAHYGGIALEFPTFLPSDTVPILGVNIGVDKLVSAGIAAVAAIGFFLFFRISPLGTRMRAVVDNPELLELAGTSAFRVRSWSWLIGCWFAAVSGILLGPLLGVEAMLLTLLVVQAYGAAAIGRFSSLPATFAGGLTVGILVSLSTKIVVGSETFSGLPPAIPFLVLFVVLLVVGKSRLVEPGAGNTAPPPAPLVSRRAARMLALPVVALAVAIPHLVGPKLPVYATALVFVLVFYSLDLLVRTSGQVSLAHAGFVAVGAATFSHFAVGAGLPWLIAVLLAGLVTVPVGMLVAIPAIRLSGLFLALATFGFGLLLQNVGYGTELLFGSNLSAPATRPVQFDGDVAFYYVLLAFAVATAALITLIRHSRIGRLLRALADSPTTLSTLGLGVNVTRTTVFAISAFIAGVAGALYASQTLNASGQGFSSYVSLLWLAVLAVNSLLGSAAPIGAALGLMVLPAYIDDPELIEWLPVGFGVAAVVVAMAGASRKRRHSAAEPDVVRHGSRAAERSGAAGPVRDRARDAARQLSPAPAMLRIGPASSTGARR